MWMLSGHQGDSDSSLPVSAEASNPSPRDASGQDNQAQPGVAGQGSRAQPEIARQDRQAQPAVSWRPQCALWLWVHAAAFGDVWEAVAAVVQQRKEAGAPMLQALASMGALERCEGLL